MRRAYALVALSLIGCNTGEEPYDHTRERDVVLGKADNGAPRKKWTFLFYGAGDNNLGDEIVAAVNKLESVGSTEDVNLIAFYDHTTLGAARAYIEHDDDLTNITSPGLKQLGAVDSGVPQTLITFASWAIANYPADNYSLIIDGHGDTTPQVLAPDMTTGHSMTLTDLWQAIDYIRQRSHRQLAVLGGDTCLSQTVEQAVELTGDAHHLVMSEDLDYGWAYDQVAQALVDAPAQTGEELAKAMVDTYGRSVMNPSITMSSIDTTKIADVTAALDGLAAVLRPYIESSPEARTAFLTISSSVYRPISKSHVDVAAFTQLLGTASSPEVVAAANALARSAESATSASFVSPDLTASAHGLTVFLPRELTEDTLAEYRVSRFAHASQWDEFVAWLNGLE